MLQSSRVTQLRQYPSQRKYGKNDFLPNLRGITRVKLVRPDTRVTSITNLLSGRVKRFSSCQAALKAVDTYQYSRDVLRDKVLSLWVAAGVSSISYNVVKAICAEHAKHPAGSRGTPIANEGQSHSCTRMDRVGTRQNSAIVPTVT